MLFTSDTRDVLGGVCADACCSLSSVHAAAVLALVWEVPRKKRKPAQRIEQALQVSSDDALALLADLARAVCRAD